MRYFSELCFGTTQLLAYEGNADGQGATVAGRLGQDCEETAPASCRLQLNIRTPLNVLRRCQLNTLPTASDALFAFCSPNFL